MSEVVKALAQAALERVELRRRVIALELWRSRVEAGANDRRAHIVRPRVDPAVAEAIDDAIDEVFSAPAAPLTRTVTLEDGSTVELWTTSRIEEPTFDARVLPCPWCKSDRVALILRHEGDDPSWRVECVHDNCLALPDLNTQADAVLAWNKLARAVGEEWPT